VGLGLVYVLFRSKPTETSATHSTATPTREGMLQIVIPATGACCAAAHKIEAYRFHKGHAPSLPLNDCSMKQGCQCRYQPVPDRRIGERRAGGEKRDSIRYEENPRRQGPARRRQAVRPRRRLTNGLLGRKP